MNSSLKHLASLHSVRLRYASQLILEDISVTVHEGQKIGLIGVNGAGKSSLLQILAGSGHISAGTKEVYGTVWYMPQVTIDLLQSRELISEFLARHREDWWQVFTELEHRYQLILDPSRTLGSLSGGELTKLLISLGSVIQPDILLLDEPTNHLDIASHLILQEFVRSYSGSVIIASHDGYFLDVTVHRIWELTEGKVREFGGNYSFYREQKRIEQEIQARRYEVALKRESKLAHSLALEERRKEQNRARDLATRHDRSMSRMDRGYLKSRAQVKAGKRKLMFDDRTAENQQDLATYKPIEQPYILYPIPTKTFGGSHVVEIRQGVLRRQDQMLIENIRLDIEKGERIVLLGQNGVGKSSLTKAIAEVDQTVILEGEVMIPASARRVYLAQNYELIHPGETVYGNVKRMNPERTDKQIRAHLRDFLFQEDDQVYQAAGTLSGGEVARLAFAMLSLEPIDLLILDEPTNNLDIIAKESLIQALTSFPGSLMIISHDVDFLSRVGSLTSYVIRDQQLIKYDLDYTEEGILSHIADLISESEE